MGEPTSSWNSRSALPHSRVNTATHVSWVRYLHIVGKKKKPNAFEEALSELRKVVPASASSYVAPAPKVKEEQRIVTAEFLRRNDDGSWNWEEFNGSLTGILSTEQSATLGQLHESDTVRLQVSITATTCTVAQIVPRSLRQLPDKERRERVREVKRRHTPPPTPQKKTHLLSAPPPGTRHIIRARVTALTESAFTWQAIDGAETMTSPSSRAHELDLDQRINVVLEDLRGKHSFVDFVAHTLRAAQHSLGELTLDAMYVLEPGDIVDAFLEFSGIPGAHDADRIGKTRPAVFIGKVNANTLSLRGLTDGAGSYGQRSGNIAIRDWQEAGLKKPSVVQEEAQEVDIADVWVTRGKLTAHDRSALGLQ